MKVKICGMRDHENILEVAELMPDYMGFIFFPESPRFVGEHFQAESINKQVQKVGVFVNATTESILAKAIGSDFTLVQLQGSETVEQCQELRSHNLLVIKAFSVSDELNHQLLKSYHNCVDFFLFDTKGKFFGGNGQRFDWHLLHQYDQQTPFFLSGGIGMDHIQDLKQLKDLNIHAVDVNSGVEASPGLKDINKVRELIDAVRQLGPKN